jgi:hypothetical protein
MAKIEYNREDNILVIDGQEFVDDGDELIQVLASRVSNLRFSDFPDGVTFVLCDKIAGSTDDIYHRSPNCAFLVNDANNITARLEVAFIPDEEATEEARSEFFERQIQNAQIVLNRMGSIVKTTVPTVYEDIAYLSVTLRLDDQLVLDAHELVGDIEAQLYDESTSNLLFLCHASEDKPFVDRLSEALDHRGVRAWYDKRELYVGDSIVEGINRALGEAVLVVAVLSPHSVRKPWVMRELNSTLMRQLGEQRIRVLPVVIEKCDLPPLLADIKYADFTSSFETGLTELMKSVRLFENGSSR